MKKSLVQILCFLLLSVTLTSVSFAQDESPGKVSTYATYQQKITVHSVEVCNEVPVYSFDCPETYSFTPLQEPVAKIFTGSILLSNADHAKAQCKADSKVGWQSIILNSSINKVLLARISNIGSRTSYHYRC